MKAGFIKIAKLLAVGTIAVLAQTAGAHYFGDRVWYDQNSNGRQDAGEPGAAGVLVEAVDCTTGLVLAHRVTDANGNYMLYSYTFAAPGSTGRYFDANVPVNSDWVIPFGATSVKVRFTAPAGYSFTTAFQGLIPDAAQNDSAFLTRRAFPSENIDDSKANSLGETGCFYFGDDPDLAFLEDLNLDAGLVAQETPRQICGRIVCVSGDQSITPLANVTVWVTNASVSLQALTDAMGNYCVQVSGADASYGVYVDPTTLPSSVSSTTPTAPALGYYLLTLDAQNPSVTDADFVFSCVSSPGTGTPGYWKNHPEAWPVDAIVIGGITYTKDAAIALMKSKLLSDKRLNMFAQLVSAKLNVLIGNESVCIDDTIIEADAWMAANTSPVAAKSNAWKIGSRIHTKLDQYNNGLLCAPHRD